MIHHFQDSMKPSTFEIEFTTWNEWWAMVIFHITYTKDETARRFFGLFNTFFKLSAGYRMDFMREVSAELIGTSFDCFKYKLNWDQYDEEVMNLIFRASVNWFYKNHWQDSWKIWLKYKVR